VYQANGGSESTQGLKLVGARRIDLDLQLYGFNDQSEYSYEELQKRFARSQAGRAERPLARPLPPRTKEPHVAEKVISTASTKP
jgi:hypothetical protein